MMWHKHVVWNMSQYMFDYVDPTQLLRSLVL